jgi:murein tripeptide amidase MpaA
LITITNFSEDLTKKKGIVFTARVHAGETSSSYIIQGVMDFLLGDSEEAKKLRSEYIFKIVPMLNPDGVIVGNHRGALSGIDLNRM